MYVNIKSKKCQKLIFWGRFPIISGKVILEIDLEHICLLAHHKLTEREEKQLAPQVLKIINWINRLEELKYWASNHQEFFRESLLFKLAFLFEKKVK